MYAYELGLGYYNAPEGRVKKEKFIKNVKIY